MMIQGNLIYEHFHDFTFVPIGNLKVIAKNRKIPDYHLKGLDRRGKPMLTQDLRAALSHYQHKDDLIGCCIAGHVLENRLNNELQGCF